MIKFFRKISQSLLIENKLSREFLLVVIGILIALQINNWNEGRKKLAKSHEILPEIAENLEYNNAQFLQEIKEEEAVVKSVDIVLENLKIFN